MDISYPLRYKNGLLLTATDGDLEIYTWIRSLLATLKGERDNKNYGIDPSIFFEAGVPGLIKEESARAFALIPEIKGEIKVVSFEKGVVTIEAIIVPSSSTNARRISTRIDLGEF
ncbi:hypothetical protein [Moorena sp. SIO4A1]|uniref:hypothetical protein n=1 Tax=Moorena sp. SIO4A1 TaxID=2607835 RepID=UPI0025D92656|nr:hypothetical protein [Moorena sp. SIO4A1]